MKSYIHMLPRELVDKIFYEVHKLHMKDVVKQMIGLIEFWRDVILNGEKRKHKFLPLVDLEMFTELYVNLCLQKVDMFL